MISLSFSLPLCGSRIIAFGRSTVSFIHPYLIDRETGEVSILSYKGIGVSADALEDMQDEETGAVIQPEEKSFMVLMPCADRETFLIYAMDGTVSLFDPYTLETGFLLGDADTSSIPMPMYYSGNGYDRFLVITVPHNGEDTFIAELSVEEE